MKKIKVRDFAAIKRVAQNVSKLINDRDKTIDKIEELQNFVISTQAIIEGHEAGVKALTDGLTSENLVKRVIEETGKTDAKGNPIKVTKYVPTDIVTYSEEDKCYYIKDVELSEPTFEEIDDTEKAPDNMVESKEDIFAETL